MKTMGFAKAHQERKRFAFTPAVLGQSLLAGF
jgi:hypothetical protein